MKELAPPDQLLKVRDAAPIIVLPPEGWYCLFCKNPPDDYLGTVEWIRMEDGTELGRCHVCGQKYVLLNNGEVE